MCSRYETTAAFRGVVKMVFLQEGGFWERGSQSKAFLGGGLPGRVGLLPQPTYQNYVEMTEKLRPPLTNSLGKMECLDQRKVGCGEGHKPKANGGNND